jgi:Probable cobalt transporter subunit (CbtA)
MDMVGNLIMRGLLVGIVAGLFAFGWAKTFGEPPVNVAIAFEASQDAMKGMPDEPEVFSRAVQGGIGLFTGVVVIGAGIGGLFGVLFALCYGRLGALGPKATALLLAFFGLMSVYVVPALKYPANPPSVGEPDTIKLRTGLYFLIMAISVASTIGGLVLRRRLVPQFGAWNASVLAFGVYLLVMALCFVVMPAINEVPSTFPAVVLWQFRLASLGIQTVLWGVLGLGFGYVAEGVVARPYQATGQLAHS